MWHLFYVQAKLIIMPCYLEPICCIKIVESSLWAGSCYTMSARGAAAGSKSSSEVVRWESEPALICANFFISSAETTEKNKSINFHWKYELWQLRFLGKIANLFQNYMHADIHWHTRQTASCCFFACLQSHAFVIFI